MTASVRASLASLTIVLAAAAAGVLLLGREEPE